VCCCGVLLFWDRLGMAEMSRETGRVGGRGAYAGFGTGARSPMIGYNNGSTSRRPSSW